MEQIVLRDYQQAAVDDTSGALAFSSNNLVINIPTGGGKSLVIAGLCREFDNHRITIMVNITELIDQIAEHLDLLNLDYSILKAGRESEFDPDHRIQLVMAQTLYARIDKVKFHCELLIQDEYHREYRTQRTTKILNKLTPDARIGLSATPYDNEGFLLKDAELIESTSVLDLQEQGFLSELKYFVPKWAESIDYSSIAKTGSDYNSAKLDEKINTNTHIDKSIQAMNQMDAKNKKSIVFCSTIEQCEKVTEAMKADGFLAESIHSKKHNKINDAILHAFKYNLPYTEPVINRKESTDPTLFDENTDTQEPPLITHLVSVAKLSTGFDVKDIMLGIMMRPTMVRSLFVQMVGRVARIHPDKTHGEILDLSKLVSTHGFHTDEYKPPVRSGDLEADKELMATIKQNQGMPNLDLALDSDEPSEIDIDKYTMTIKALKEREEKLRDKKADITNWSMKELANAYSITNDFSVVLKIGAEIMTRKFGKPISKKGFEYNYDPEWLGELIQPVIEKYPEVKFRFLKAMKTRTRNIIKEGKNFNGLRFFITFLADRYAEEIAPIYQQETDDVEDYTGVKQPPVIDIDEDDIPF